jgi:hypothetical protein
MMKRKDEYENFVEHPRYGKRPRITGLNPETDCLKVFIHWHSPESCRIPGTAINADLTKQTRATVPVTHYFDVKRNCRECNRPFIFFAEEQKHWYEELGFGVDSDCVRCPQCRKRQQVLARTRERYEGLFHLAERNVEQDLEMADCSLTLIENDVFHPQQTERVRMLLNGIPEDHRPRRNYADLLSRLSEIEKSKRTPGAR